jgi:hypothetical protein
MTTGDSDSGGGGGDNSGNDSDSGWARALDRYRERRARGTRCALDWRHGYRQFLMVPIGLQCGAFGGFDLVSKGAWWQRELGVLVLAATAAAIGALARWLIRPVDEDSLQRLLARREELKWRTIWPHFRRRSRLNPPSDQPGHERS